MAPRTGLSAPDDDLLVDEGTSELAGDDNVDPDHSTPPRSGFAVSDYCPLCGSPHGGPCDPSCPSNAEGGDTISAEGVWMENDDDLLNESEFMMEDSDLDEGSGAPDDCSFCHGSGVIEDFDDAGAQYPEIDCVVCNGTGKADGGKNLHDTGEGCEFCGAGAGEDCDLDCPGSNVHTRPTLVPTGDEGLDEATKTEKMKQSVGERLQLAYNPSTPGDVLAQLATDTDSYVRQGVAGNPSTPKEETLPESTDFDKFMDNTLLKEHRAKRVDRPEDNPMRRRAALHQDRPNNRIRFTPGGR